MDPTNEEQEAMEFAGEPSQATATNVQKKRSKKYTSPVWQYFEKCLDGQFALCTVCGEKYQHSNNTSNLAKVYEISII